MQNCRITGTDTVEDIIVKLVDGLPGAIVVCCEALKHGDRIDPDSSFGGLGVLLSFDQLGIYGSRIWMLYKDVCKQDLGHTIGILRGHQLGFVTDAQLNHAIDNYGEGIDVSSIMVKVRERLPNFKG